MTIDIHTTVCFSGHRPDRLGGYDRNNPIIAPIRDRTRGKIEAAFTMGYRTFISGMAQGFDQEAFDLVLDLRSVHASAGVRIIAAVPFADQDKTWPHPARARYRTLLSVADEIVYTHPDRTYEKWKLFVRNEWMVDHAGLVIACWDGTRSGTKHCVDYAKDKDVPVWNVWR